MKTYIWGLCPRRDATDDDVSVEYNGAAGDHLSPLRLLEQSAESASQSEKPIVASDALWVEAAQTALAREEFGKARGYLLKALAQNPQHASASQLLKELPLIDEFLLKRMSKD